MHVIFFLATLATLFIAGHAAFLKNLLFCEHRCNPKPEERLRHCLFRCGWRVGSYYDGSPCWILGRLGNRLNLEGYCRKGICVHSRNGYTGSKAEKQCCHKTTTTVSVATTGTTTHAIPVTSPQVPESGQKSAEPNSSLPVTLPSGTTNASASTKSSSPTNLSSITKVENAINTAEGTTAANGVTQASSDPNSSPTTQHHSVNTAAGQTIDVNPRTPASSPPISSSTTSVENETTTTEDHTNASVTSPVFFPNDTSSGTSQKNDTPPEDTTIANTSTHEISTASTLIITEVRSQRTSSEETTENITPGTRTYGTRPAWLNERFRTATTTKATPEANASNEVVVSSTSEATSADSSHTVSTRGTETPEPIETQETTVSVAKETVGKNSSDDATGTTAVSSTSNMSC